MTKVLVVDDDIPLARTFGNLLQEAGYEPLLAYTAEDGLQLAQTEAPGLALLDVMVPSMGGWDLCRRIRLFSDMPIIFLTALGNVENVVKGLELGADDYLVKPVEPAEFIARVKVRLRRPLPSQSASQPLSLDDGDLIVDLAAHEISVYKTPVMLTPREFELFAILIANINKVVTTADLAQQAWGMADEGGIGNVKPYIHYLRKKIEADPAAPRWIQTVRGVGYRFTSG